MRDDDPSPGEADPAVSLWCAVISTAWNDLRGEPHAAMSPVERAQARYEAAQFFLAQAGPWRRSREEVATTAGIDPDALRERALHALRNPPPRPSRRPGRPRGPRPGGRPATVRDLLGTGPATAAELAEVMGVTPVDARVAVGDLRRAGYVVRRDRAGRYHLDHPPGSPEVAAAQPAAPQAR